MLSALSPLALLPDVGGGEMMLILLVVLLLFGGDKMPQMAKSLGKSISAFKRAANDVEREIKRAIDEVPDTPDIKATLLDATKDRPKPVSPPTPPPPASAVSSPAAPPAPPAVDAAVTSMTPPPPPPAAAT